MAPPLIPVVSSSPSPSLLDPRAPACPLLHCPLRRTPPALASSHPARVPPSSLTAAPLTRGSASLSGRLGGTAALRRPALVTSAALSTDAPPVPSFAAEFPEVPSLATLQELAGPPVVPDRLAHAKERKFSENGALNEGVPEVILYRDDAAWCPYCERVWLQLEEKKVPYKVEKVNLSSYGPKPQWFLDMAPSGQVPVIKLDGKVVTESIPIMKALEEAFPSHNPLIPQDAKSQEKVEELMKMESFTLDWAKWARAPLEGGEREELRAKFEGTLLRLETTIAESGGPFFLGDKFSILDALFAPFIERVSAFVAFWQGVPLRGNPKWPFLNAWIEAMDAKPAYKAMKSDDYSLNRIITYLGPIPRHPDGEAQRDKVEGKNGWWNLPLRPEETSWGFDDGTGVNRAKDEAAQALVTNHAAVVGFALRALEVTAAEAPDKAAHVSAGLRHVAHALVVGTEAAGPPPAGLDPQPTAAAAAYLRDRVGVPRDLTYPAARQLRAHLHWLVRSLGSEL